MERQEKKIRKWDVKRWEEMEDGKYKRKVGERYEEGDRKE